MIQQITPGQPHIIGSGSPLLPVSEALFWVLLVVLSGLAVWLLWMGGRRP